MTITGADHVNLDEVTDVREIIDTCGPGDCKELTRQLATGTAEIQPGKLIGWGREATLRDAGRNYYHVDTDL